MSNPQLEIITIEHSHQHDASTTTTTTTTTAVAAADFRTEESHCTATSTTAPAPEGAELQVANASKHRKNGVNDSHCSLLTGSNRRDDSNISSTEPQQHHHQQQSLSSGISSTGSFTLIDIESGVVGKQPPKQQPHLHFASSSELLQLHKKDGPRMNLSSAAASSAASNGSSINNANTGDTSPAAPSTIITSSAISTSQTNLVRKHSCGDLVSRLKSRKLLGVGESSENRGEVYRSKISQLLGHSEHLFAKFPLAFWHWYAILIVIHIVNGFWNLFGHLLLQPSGQTGASSDTSSSSTNRNSMSDKAALPSMKDVDEEGLLAISKFFRQFCGILYLAFAILLWRFYRINDKGLVRYILFACSIFSLAKIILLLYYDHCSVIELKDWLISFVCSSRCGPELGDASTTFSSRSCSLFSRASSSSSQNIIYSSGELTIYLLVESLEVMVNLLYRHRMASGGGGGGGATSSSGSSSLLTTGAIGASRRVSTPANAGAGGVNASTAAFPCCEYVSLLLGNYVVHPVAGLFRRRSTATAAAENNNQKNQTGESSEGRTYSSVPATPTTLGKPPPPPPSPKLDDQIITAKEDVIDSAAAIDTKAAAEVASNGKK